MDKFERQLIKPVEVKLKNSKGEEDVFLLTSLPFSHIEGFFKCLGTMAKMGDVSNLKGLSEDEQTKKLLDLMDEPTVIIIKDLVLATLKESYPEQKEGILKKFTAQHFMELFPVIIELNTKTMNTEPNDKGTIQQVKR